MASAAGAVLRAGGWTLVLPVRAVWALPRRLRRRVLALLLAALALACGYQFWLRDSSLVAVERVSIAGLTAEEAPRIRAALTAAARDMTTLHVRRGELERALAPFPVVRSFEVEPDFPSTLRIRVVEHRPVAILRAGTSGGGVPVAADGTLLRGVVPSDPLPAMTLGEPLAGGVLAEAAALRRLRVVAAAPPALLGRVRAVRETRARGLVVHLRRGPRLVFGDLTRLEAKWAAAAAVLADPDSAGAAYVDLRVPERPAAGGLAPPAAGDAPPGEVPQAGPAPSGAEDQAGVPPAQPAPGAAGDPAAPTGPPAAQQPAQPAIPPGDAGGAAAP